ncbi:flagellin [Phenylobacterium sp.]|uniref:flagellin n=1 Tax=Phenylobacterium sp. TaxID=1871053 RepID=UPI0008C645E4|nr:flagellin [Phenylobacterium sp.]MBA4792910.1 flagellin [Phenylobacterium sp.]MBC7167216.1 flagellin [Phenylobacterium sp.]OHB35880.1 MAG: flagellin [Phenylobacterium sp. RIFCSPHIGHO2_01_FULL_70_10]
MAISVHTNKSALVALQNLNKTNDELAGVQNRINTGLKIGNAKDNASVWSIAQGQRADIGALGAVKMSLNRAQSISEVSMAAGESVSDLLVQLKEKVVGAMDTSLDTQARKALDDDFKSILRQITQVIENAEFDGANILDGTSGASIRFLANADANAYITLSGQNLSLGGSILTIASTASISTSTLATNILTQLDASIANVNASLGSLGAQAKQIEAHNKFVDKLTDVLTAGVGNLVDADLAKESARLQALQVQQQLGAQALSIANEAPQVVLSLFQ